MEPVYGLVAMLIRRPLRHGLRWRIEGLERISPAGPVILASNHVSYLDPLCVAYVADLAGRRVRFLAKAELFRKRGLAELLRVLRQIPVERGSADASGSLQAAADALGAGECVVVFPEGTISPDLDPMAGKTGTARLARAAGVPVIPMGIWGTHRILTKGRKPSFRLGVAVTVALGEAVVVDPDANPRESTDRIMAAICAQVARAREAYFQEPKDGKDRWWYRDPQSARLRSCRGRIAQDLLDQTGGAGSSEPAPPADPAAGRPPAEG